MISGFRSFCFCRTTWISSTESILHLLGTAVAGGGGGCWLGCTIVVLQLTVAVAGAFIAGINFWFYCCQGAVSVILDALRLSYCQSMIPWLLVGELFRNAGL